MRRKALRKGFTLVEIALSSAFVGVLSIAIVLIINDTVASYRRGLTLSQVNTTGMDIVDDLRTAVQNSSSRSVVNECVKAYGDNNTVAKQACEENGAYNFVSVTKKVDMTINGKLEKDVPIYGAFCTGTYSYIWNSGYFESKEASFEGKNRPATLTYYKPAIIDGKEDKTEITVSSSTRKTGVSDIDTGRPFRLLKVRDNNRAVCMAAVRYNQSTHELTDNYNLPSGGIDNRFNITSYGVLEEDPVDLILANNENDLVLYELAVAPPAESTTRLNIFYSVSFILGTIDGGINIKQSGNNCTPPADYQNEKFDYCAINKFNFAVQASGER